MILRNVWNKQAIHAQNIVTELHQSWEEDLPNVHSQQKDLKSVNKVMEGVRLLLGYRGSYFLTWTKFSFTVIFSFENCIMLLLSLSMSDMKVYLLKSIFWQRAKNIGLYKTVIQIAIHLSILELLSWCALHPFWWWH